MSTRKYRDSHAVDFVIVGSGAAGGVIARELARANLSVVVLEQGPRLAPADFEHDELKYWYAGGITNDAVHNPQTFRADASQKTSQPLVRPSLVYARAVGGTTLHYTANYWRFREIDFHERSTLGPISGTGFADWPISYAELEPYYTKVDWEIGVSGLAGVNPFDSPRTRGYPMPPLPVKSSGVLFERGARKLGLHPVPAPLAINSQVYNGRPGCVHCGFCHGFACEVTAKASTLTTVIPQAEATGNCEIRANSYVSRVEIDKRGHVTGVAYFDKDRREHFQRARAVVLAANGAETPRLLLNSASPAFPHGLANGSGMVGKHLMFNYTSVARGVFEHELNEYKSVQVSRILFDFYDSDPKRGFYGGGGLDARIGPQPTIWAQRIAGEGPGWGAGLKERLREFPRSMQVACHGTSLPLETNNVTLDPTLRDAWGIPAIRVTYRDHPDDLATARFLQDRGAEILDAAGALRVSKAPVNESTAAVHLLGTCRMGDDPTKSVVDRNHRSHDVPNLFICDGSSLVTSGRGQPTMTIQALAFRAGELIAGAARRNEILKGVTMKDLNQLRNVTLRAAIAAALGFAVAPQLMAQDAPAAEEEENFDEVVVTGTRVATRTRLDTLAPVDVLPQETLTSTGSTELAEALSTAAPSLNFPRPSITDGTDHIRPATLRGLAPDQTLVLVNSKRRHQSALVNVNGSVGRGSAAVDLNAIPLAAIETVEVLRDGASAQYGSDAIAGVINLRLRDAREGGNASVTYGEYNTNVQTERGERHEDDGGTVTASGWVGLPLGAEGFLTLSGEYRDRDPTSRGDFDNRVPGSPVTSRYGDADVEDITAYVNAGVPLEGDWNIYGWAGYQQREGNSAAFPRIFNDPRNVPAIYPNGFLPLITTDIDDLALGWGVRGKLGSWDADVSLVYGSNEVAYGVEDSLNASYGAASQTEFDAGAMKYDQLVFNAGIVRTFEVGGLPEGINVAFGIEARTESYSIEAGEPTSYNRGPVAGAAAGAQGFPGFQPSNELDEDREAYSAYADVEARLTEKMLASVAIRGEDYSDFGSAVTGKLAGRYDFTDSFALRGAVSTGFRAPGLQQEFFTSTATNFINGVPFEVGTFPATSDVAITLGAQPLDAEESTNYSFGTVLRFGGFEATIDAYRIDIEDRIVLSENLNTPQVAALIAPFGANVARFFINGVDTKTEGIDLVTRYLWRTEKAGRFEFVAAGNWNDTEVEKLPSTNVIDNICVGQPAPCTPPVLFARNNTLSFEEGTPDSKISLGVDWVMPLGATNFGVNLKGTRYGEVVEPGIPQTPEINAGVLDARDLHIQADWVVDLTFSAKLMEDKLALSIGADNLFDQYPDRVPNARPLPNPPGGTVNLNTQNALGYSRYSPYGFNGRFVFARLAYNW